MPFLDTRTNGADHSVLEELQERMETLLDEMDREAPAYAKARQISEFMGDRRKAALSDAFVSIRDGDPEESAGAAEHRARASKGYKDKMQELMKDQLSAETTMTNYHLLQSRLDIARSLYACERTKIERGL